MASNLLMKNWHTRHNNTKIIKKKGKEKEKKNVQHITYAHLGPKNGMKKFQQKQVFFFFVCNPLKRRQRQLGQKGAVRDVSLWLNIESIKVEYRLKNEAWNWNWCVLNKFFFFFFHMTLTLSNFSQTFEQTHTQTHSILKFPKLFVIFFFFAWPEEKNLRIFLPWNTNFWGRSSFHTFMDVTFFLCSPFALHTL